MMRGLRLKGVLLRRDAEQALEDAGLRAARGAAVAAGPDRGSLHRRPRQARRAGVRPDWPRCAAPGPPCRERGLHPVICASSCPHCGRARIAEEDEALPLATYRPRIGDGPVEVGALAADRFRIRLGAGRGHDLVKRSEVRAHPVAATTEPKRCWARMQSAAAASRRAGIAKHRRLTDLLDAASRPRNPSRDLKSNPDLTRSAGGMSAKLRNWRGFYRVIRDSAGIRPSLATRTRAWPPAAARLNGRA